MSNEENIQDQLLRLLTTQNERIAQALERQNETIEDMRNEQNMRIEEQNSRMEEQNKRMEEIATTLKKLVENTTLNTEIASLMESSNKFLEEQSASTKDLVSAIKTLEKNSILDHNEQPLAKHEIGVHEPGWRAVFETIMENMKNQVERWRNGLDSSLIFVALFVTIITTFQGPVTQNLSPNPADLTNSILGNLTTIVYEIAVLNGLAVPDKLPQPEPFRPDLTDQVVTLFWYSSLLLSLITAILSLFGRQWVEHLTKKPTNHSYKDKSRCIDLRLTLANKLLRPLLDSLHPILIVSIILFIVGLLFQLWSLSFSVGKPSVLVLTSSLGCMLVVLLAILTAVTLVHGVRKKESPFTTSTSLAIRGLLTHSDEGDSNSVENDSKADAAMTRKEVVAPGVGGITNDLWDLYRLLCYATQQMGEMHHLEQVSSVPFTYLLNSQDLSKIGLAVDTIVSMLESDASVKAKLTIASNLCIFPWSIGNEMGQQCVDCQRRLLQAFQTIEEDTPANQDEVKMAFFIAQMVVLVRFSGETIVLKSLENKEELKFFIKFFKFNPQKVIDEEIVTKTRKAAYKSCHKWLRRNLQLVSDSIDSVDFLDAIVHGVEATDDFNLLGLIVDTAVAVLQSDSTYAKEHVVESLCTSHWHICEDTELWHGIPFCRKLFDALRDAETVDYKEYYSVVRLIVVLKHCGVNISLRNLKDREGLQKVYMGIFKLEPYHFGQYDQEIVEDARKEAISECRKLVKDFPDWFNIVDDDGLLSAIIGDNLNDDNQLELVVDMLISALGPEASWKAKETSTQRMCTIDWNFTDRISHQMIVKSHRRLHDALVSAEERSQDESKWSFFTARLIILLKFSGVDSDLHLPEFVRSATINSDTLDITEEEEGQDNLTSEKALQEICLEVFELPPEQCIDEDLLKEAKFFILHVILQHSEDSWKETILPHLHVEDVTIVLQLISAEAREEKEDYSYLTRTLSLILSLCQWPSVLPTTAHVSFEDISTDSHSPPLQVVFPIGFDISNIIRFATFDEDRFDGIVCPVNVTVILSWLTIMDDDLLRAQRYVPEFLGSLAGHEDSITAVREDIPLTPGTIDELRNRMAMTTE